MRCGSSFLVLLTLHSFLRHVVGDRGDGDPCDAVGQLGIDWELDVWKKTCSIYSILVCALPCFWAAPVPFYVGTEAKTVGSLVSYFQPFGLQVWKSG